MRRKLNKRKKLMNETQNMNNSGTKEPQEKKKKSYFHSSAFIFQYPSPSTAQMPRLNCVSPFAFSYLKWVQRDHWSQTENALLSEKAKQHESLQGRSAWKHSWNHSFLFNFISDSKGKEEEKNILSSEYFEVVSSCSIYSGILISISVSPKKKKKEKIK